MNSNIAQYRFERSDCMHIPQQLHALECTSLIAKSYRRAPRQDCTFYQPASTTCAAKRHDSTGQIATTVALVTAALVTTPVFAKAPPEYISVQDRTRQRSSLQRETARYSNANDASSRVEANALSIPQQAGHASTFSRVVMFQRRSQQ